jgi:hypothetical protein
MALTSLDRLLRAQVWADHPAIASISGAELSFQELEDTEARLVSKVKAMHNFSVRPHVYTAEDWYDLNGELCNREVTARVPALLISAELDQLLKLAAAISPFTSIAPVSKRYFFDEIKELQPLCCRSTRYLVDISEVKVLVSELRSSFLYSHVDATLTGARVQTIASKLSSTTDIFLNGFTVHLRRTQGIGDGLSPPMCVLRCVPLGGPYVWTVKAATFLLEAFWSSRVDKVVGRSVSTTQINLSECGLNLGPSELEPFVFITEAVSTAFSIGSAYAVTHYENAFRAVRIADTRTRATSHGFAVGKQHPRSHFAASVSSVHINMLFREDVFLQIDGSCMEFDILSLSTNRRYISCATKDLVVIDRSDRNSRFTAFLSSTSDAHMNHIQFKFTTGQATVDPVFEMTATGACYVYLNRVTLSLLTYLRDHIASNLGHTRQRAKGHVLR